MSLFAYFDGEKWVENLTMKDVRTSAMSGVITETTLIRNPDGQEKEAKFFGLVFSDTPPPANDVSPTEEESIMQPAIKIIEMMVVLAGVCAAISGVVAIGGLVHAMNWNFQTRYEGFWLFGYGISATISFIFTAMTLVILKYFLMCLDSMERSFRKIEKNTRKEE